MASIDDRFDVHLTLDIRKHAADGSTTPFDITPKIMYDCNREVMHAIESAIGLAMIELGDQGIVLLGGDEAAARLEAAKASREKVRGSKK